MLGWIMYLSHMAMGMMIIMREHFKRYLIACEYLQLDPTQEYKIDYVKERCEYAMQLWNKNDYGYKEFALQTKWLYKNYKDCVGWWYGLLKKAQRAKSNGSLIIHKGTVADFYIKQPISQINYEVYSNIETNQTLIALVIVISIVVALFFILRALL